MKTVELLFIDLDDTVYPQNIGIWPYLGNRIYSYMRDVLDIPQDQVVAMRERLFIQYGTTMRGLQHELGIDIHDYLDYVHGVDLSSYLQADQELRQALEAIPQEKWIFTNADYKHAEQVLGLLGIRDLFSGIIDVLDTNPWCKPQPQAFEIGLRKAGNPDPTTCLFIDDRIPNLDMAKALGMKTLLVDIEPDHLGHHPVIQKLAQLPIFLENNTSNSRDY